MDTILEIQDLKVYFRTIFGDAKSLDGASLRVYEREVLGIAGESGCGKSTLVEGALKLVKPPGYIHSGKVLYNGRNLLELDDEEFRKIRWKELSYIPQGSMNSLNPVIKIEEQMIDGIISHIDISYPDAKEIALEALSDVGLPSDVAQMFPHELSGGMRQRVCIAMSICLRPKIIFADEPVTALDVVMQKLNLQTIGELKERFGVTVVMVAHDMAWHAEVADRIAIMYAGKIVEIGTTSDIFGKPLHPYTKGLLDAVPSLERRFSKSIPGIAPSPLSWPSGCRFHPRCSYKMGVCEEIDPPLIEIEKDHFVACHIYGGR
jgi:peptide/nickel transport system ATP-binding protein